jgi:glucose/arabinose dehydrogenase
MLRSISIALSLLVAPVSLAQAPTTARPQVPAPPSPRATEVPDLTLERLWPEIKFVRPIQMIQVPDQPNLWWAAEQPGTIRLLDMTAQDAKEAPLVVDLTEPVNDRTNEEGLLSIAFHPDYPTKREVYMYYSAAKPMRSVLSRFTVSADGRSVDPASEQVILEQSQPYWNHNGGTVLFGKDGFLYLSLGDGGAANDPHDNSQNLTTMLGKVIRIDVNATSDGKRYAIPKDNPFVGREDALPEIWAYGLRNVWRMHFDRATGDLWAGDVGQNLWEEISIIVKGGNYGWNRREGFHPFSSKENEGFIDPVVEYSHKEGVSVTGGFVYRGSKIPGLVGAYLYADFGTPKVWAIRMVDGKATEPKVVAQRGASLFSSFAEDKDGELYIMSFEGGQNRGQAGAIWRIRQR